jgi:hypothetical protein
LSDYAGIVLDIAEADGKFPVSPNHATTLLVQDNKLIPGNSQTKDTPSFSRTNYFPAIQTMDAIKPLFRGSTTSSLVSGKAVWRKVALYSFRGLV